MANNFRKEGQYYISKGGHDLLLGTEKETPKKTLIPLKAPNITIVGAGQYNTGNFPTGYSNGTAIVEGDGEVVIKNINVIANNNQTNWLLKGLTIMGGAIIRPNSSNRGITIEQCKMINTSVIIYGGGGVIKSIIINNQSNDNLYSVNTSILINCVNAINIKLTDSYVEPSSTILFSGSPLNFKNNNIQGVVNLGDIAYAIQDKLIGTPQDNAYATGVEWLTEANLTTNGYTGTIAGWDAAVATCMNRDPKFNDVSKLDFTLQADSPHLGAAQNGVDNIGGTEYAKSFYAGTPDPDLLYVEASNTIDTTGNLGDWKLKNGESEGWIREIIRISNVNEVIEKMDYIGNLSFDADAEGGSSDNTNVPDSKPLSGEYPFFNITTANAADNLTVIVANHGAQVGQTIWVNGEYKVIDAIPDANTIIVDSALSATILSGVVVKYGAEEQLAALNPNRLNYLLRSTVADNFDVADRDNPLIWENNNLAPAGQYLAQEWGNEPRIDNNNQVGYGDDKFDENYSQPIQIKVIDRITWLRNDYKS